ncbi:uncharacterized protein LOC142230353 [Haematobia irritans]|uniref:uncharacterized protein LOC142230353 n=1 Tax=Haematobia irritans TaxID=7368 RepID=UPI003F4FAC8C
MSDKKKTKNNHKEHLVVGNINGKCEYSTNGNCKTNMKLTSNHRNCRGNFKNTMTLGILAMFMLLSAKQLVSAGGYGSGSYGGSLSSTSMSLGSGNSFPSSSSVYADETIFGNEGLENRKYLHLKTLEDSIGDILGFLSVLGSNGRSSKGLYETGRGNDPKVVVVSLDEYSDDDDDDDNNRGSERTPYSNKRVQGYSANTDTYSFGGKTQAFEGVPVGSSNPKRSSYSHGNPDSNSNQEIARGSSRPNPANDFGFPHPIGNTQDRSNWHPGVKPQTFASRPQDDNIDEFPGFGLMENPAKHDIISNPKPSAYGPKAGTAGGSEYDDFGGGFESPNDGFRGKEHVSNPTTFDLPQSGNGPRRYSNSFNNGYDRPNASPNTNPSSPGTSNGSEKFGIFAISPSSSAGRNNRDQGVSSGLFGIDEPRRRYGTNNGFEKRQEINTTPSPYGEGVGLSGVPNRHNSADSNYGGNSYPNTYAATSAPSHSYGK